MRIVESIVAQAVLLSLSLVIQLLRCWIRLWVERRKSLTLPDYLVWGGWFFTLGWFVCSAVALNIQLTHPLVEPDLTTDSVEYLRTVFVASYCFDIGLYFPKFSIIAFYWWLIPSGFRRLRIAVYLATGYTACSFLATLLTDTLIAGNISYNWSIEYQLYSTWNSYNGLIINWVLNWSSDVLLFVLPFFIINCIKLRKRQKIALCGVFSLGLITLAISLARFIAYAGNFELDDPTGNLWCTAEMCTANIVVSLPALKALIIRASPTNTSAHSNTGYMQHRTPRIFSEPSKSGEDEVELVVQDSGKVSLSTHRTASANDVRVTTHVTVERHALEDVL
ncbi:uncharacterized protein CC84DRAFT_1222950 [Paraphaeosphaeria sporulosa]|uniref:Rhodopsin domain-containing protein n=1 Tax=Paraphaeosphaeria sporulosa TaxID=1460663 RepID=A0A177BY42_9PLEO|nr:uncharacterized protein CC84DRAFT_1222950 [Paraphaeosphaeria sporulosa]OAF99249.1 hypothetical protein CC84DRAFT_1222950 [Paraphaeosphaeria sporulosa]